MPPGAERASFRESRQPMAVTRTTPATAPTGNYPEGRPSGWNFKRDWSFLVPAALLTLMMLGAAANYLFNVEAMAPEFARLGFPAWLRPTLGVAKVLAVLAIWFAPTAPLRHFAYAGLLFNFIMALMAHAAAGDGEFGGALAALVLLGIVMWRDPRG